MELFEKKLWARAVIRDTVRNDIEFQSVSEIMNTFADDDTDAPKYALRDQDARDVHNLIGNARIEVFWDG